MLNSRCWSIACIRADGQIAHTLHSINSLPFYKFRVKCLAVKALCVGSAIFYLPAASCLVQKPECPNLPEH